MVSKAVRLPNHCMAAIFGSPLCLRSQRTLATGPTYLREVAIITLLGPLHSREHQNNNLKNFFGDTAWKQAG